MIQPRYPDSAPPHLRPGSKFIGYWQNKSYPYLSDPRDWVDPNWNPVERLAVIAHLKAGRPWEHWEEASHCRFGCKEPNGSSDLTDGVYVWPEGFVHYLEKHDVKVPREFIEHVLKLRGEASMPQKRAV